MKELKKKELVAISGGGNAKSCNGWQLAAHVAGGFLIGATSLNPVVAATGGIVSGVFCTPGN